MKKLFKKANKGFTLLEMVIVVTIMGVLVSVGAVSYGSYIDTTKTSANQQEVLQIVQSIDMAISMGYKHPAEGSTTQPKLIDGYDDITVAVATAVYQKYAGVKIPTTAKLTITAGLLSYEYRDRTTKYNLTDKMFVD